MSASGHELRVVFTGTFDRARFEIERDARLDGVWVDANVTKRTQYLVVGTTPGRTKVNKAQAYGIPLIDYRKFLRMVEARGSSRREVQRGDEMKPIEIEAPWLQALATKRGGVRF